MSNTTQPKPTSQPQKSSWILFTETFTVYPPTCTTQVNCAGDRRSQILSGTDDEVRATVRNMADQLALESGKGWVAGEPKTREDGEVVTCDVWEGEREREREERGQKKGMVSTWKNMLAEIEVRGRRT
jgi:hypothetical protein